MTIEEWPLPAGARDAFRARSEQWSRCRADTTLRRSPVGESRAIKQERRLTDHIRGNSIAGHKAEWRPRAGEEWLAVTKHDGVQVESILIDQTKIGEALRQVWSANFNLSGKLSLQPTYRRLKVILSGHSSGAAWNFCTPG